MGARKLQFHAGMLDRKLLCFSKFGDQEARAIQLGKVKQQLHEKNEYLES